MYQDIINYLKNEDLSFSKLIKKIEKNRKFKELSYKRKRVLLRKTLREMIKNKVVSVSRKNIRLTGKQKTQKGIFLSTNHGYGFVSIEDSKEEVFIPRKHTGNAIHGDLVEISVTKGKNGSFEGKVIKTIKRKKTSIHGYVEKMADSFYLFPIDKKFPPLKLVNKSIKDNSSLVEAEIISNESAKIKRIINIEEKQKDVEVVVNEFNLHKELSESALKELDGINCEISDEDKRQRVDLREKIIFTIDGDDAKDFDDAVSLEKLKDGNYLLGVHIADVSHYVKKGTFLDKEALERGVSVYFPEKVIPMLPPKLSENVCSLNPNEDKLALSIFLEFNEEGKLLKTKFFQSIIKSKFRMTYKNVEKILQGDKNLIKKYSKIYKTIIWMHELAEKLWNRRKEDGSLDFDLPEPGFYLDNAGKIFKIDINYRLSSERIIEEFMLTANATVATHLSKMQVPMIYRIHEEPDAKKLENLNNYLKHFGIPIIKNGKQSYEFQKALKKVTECENSLFLQLMILKSLKLAKYSHENYGHYGLAKQYYTHFTSPIRRYPDLIMHRVLKNFLISEQQEYTPEELKSISNLSSFNERNGDDAENFLTKWRILRYLKSKLGERFSGTISKFNSRGIEVILDENFIEGKIPYSDIDRDYYIISKSKLTIKGKRSGRTFKVGQKLDLTLSSVDLKKMEILLSLN
ncbi:MAG: ribonuclease R [Acidobacteriota bacterium]